MAQSTHLSTGQRIDPVIQYDPQEVKRIKKLKMCNVHYLRNDCPYDPCTHGHDYKPNKNELMTLRYVSRMTPCHFGSECDDPKWFVFACLTLRISRATFAISISSLIKPMIIAYMVINAQMMLKERRTAGGGRTVGSRKRCMGSIELQLEPLRLERSRKYYLLI